MKLLRYGPVGQEKPGLLDADGVWADHAPLPGLHDIGRAGLDSLIAIEKRCLALPAFADAMPDRQPDAVK